MTKVTSRALLIVAGIVVAIIVLYAPVLDYEFSEMDDSIIVDEQPFLSDLSHAPALWKRAFSLRPGPGSAPYHRPLINLSYMLDSRFEPFDAGNFHRTNVGLHALNLVLLWLVLRCFWGDTWKTYGGLLLFGLHPMTTHAISWIPGRCDLLMTTFGLAAFLALLKWRAGAGVGFLVVHLIAALGALWSKEAAIALLPIGLVWLLYQRQDRTRLAYFAGGWVAVIGLFLLFWLPIYKGYVSQHAAPPLADLVKGLPVLAYDFAKLCLPVRLEVMGDSADLDAWMVVLGGMALAALVGCGVYLKKAAWVWLLGSLVLIQLPSLVTVKSHVLENRLYAPSLFFAIWLAGTVYAWLGDRRRWLYLAFLVLAGLSYAYQVRDYLPHFADARSFNKAAYAAAPQNPTAAGAYGHDLMREGKFREAETILREVVEKWPNRAIAWNNLGVVYLRTNRFREAKTAFQESVRSDPTYWRSLQNLIVVNALLDDWGEMETLLRTLLELDRRRFDELASIAAQMERQGRLQPAAGLRQRMAAVRRAAP